MRMLRPLLCVLLTPVLLPAQGSPSLADKVDRVIGPLATTTAPGCAVGVAQNGEQVQRAFGMAELEHNVANTPTTIFESGSMAKQFTAASIVLLALDGKLSLDEPARKYLPELPDYGAPLTVRHLLTHTGGVRDWTPVMALAGLSRGERMITQAFALDVTLRQHALDFPPGSEYSYSNSGYTLLATIIERVSGQSLDTFTAERLFKPLGMGDTRWRTDYTRLVPHRAQAYARDGKGWKLDMPFMNVVGNGGLLTSVGDLLKWNAMLDGRTLGRALVDSMERPMTLTSGKTIEYALGLHVSPYRGLRTVSHSGVTAGYHTNIERVLDRRLSIAIMCNAAFANPVRLTTQLIDAILSPLPAPPVPDTIAMPPADLQKRAGTYRDLLTHLPLQVSADGGGLSVQGAPLHPLRDGGFLAGEGPVRWEFEMTGDASATARRITPNGDSRFVRTTLWSPSAAELGALAGDWHSDDAEGSFTLKVENGKLAMYRRIGGRSELRPLYRDTFAAPQFQGVIWSTHEAAGGLMLHVGTGRMRDMPFVKVQ